MNNEKNTALDKVAVTLIAVNVLLLFLVLATKNKYVSVVFGVFVFASGLWLLYVARKKLARSLNSKHWIKVPYEVAELKFTMELPSALVANQKFIPFFKIKYRYKGCEFVRDSAEDLNLPVNYVFASNREAHKYLNEVKNFKYGKFAYVNPDNPRIAFLCPGIPRDQWGMLFFAVILIFLPVLTFAGLLVWR